MSAFRLFKRQLSKETNLDKNNEMVKQKVILLPFDQVKQKHPLRGVCLLSNN